MKWNRWCSESEWLFSPYPKNGCFYYEEDLCWCKRNESWGTGDVLEHAYLGGTETGVHHSVSRQAVCIEQR